MANELELLGVILVNFLQIDQRIVYIQLKLRLQEDPPPTREINRLRYIPSIYRRSKRKTNLAT